MIALSGLALSAGGRAPRRRRAVEPVVAIEIRAAHRHCDEHLVAAVIMAKLSSGSSICHAPGSRRNGGLAWHSDRGGGHHRCQRAVHADMAPAHTAIGWALLCGALLLTQAPGL